MRTLTNKNVLNEKITLNELRERKELITTLKAKYELLGIEEKLSVNGLLLGRKLNNAIRQYNICKRSFYGGNNYVSGIDPVYFKDLIGIYSYRTVNNTISFANSGIATIDYSTVPNEFFPYNGTLSAQQMRELIVVSSANLISSSPTVGTITTTLS